MKKQNFITFMAILLATTPDLFAQDSKLINEMRRLQKCYGIMVGERIPLNDTLWTQVKSGSLSGTKACMQVFAKAKLDSNGSIPKVSGKPNDVGIKILSNFLKYYKSTFQIADFSENLGNNRDRATVDIIDANEPVYHVLYSIFGKDQEWRDAISRDYSLYALRQSDYPNRKRSIQIINNGANIPTFVQGQFETIKDDTGRDIVVPHRNYSVETFDVEPVQTGLLYGIIPEFRDGVATNPRVKALSNISTSDIHQHYGAGAIGSQGYLLANMGSGNFPNGNSVYRRWGRNVVEDFLCRLQPTLRAFDVAKEVYPTSNIAYRTGSSCMACHGTMDTITGAIRNNRIAYTHNTNASNINTEARVKFVGIRNTDLAAAAYPTISADGNFYRRTAEGRLFYRSYDGQLVDEKMIGLHELGDKFAETNDFYVCAAKRMYKMFTGVDVDLSDEGDVNTKQFSTGELKQRNRVINLGLKLKNHQSIEKMIEEIVSSDSFIITDKGV